MTELTAPTVALSTQLDAYSQALIERAHRFEDDADPYLRGLIATRVYRDRPELPTVLKRAEILAQTLEQLEPVVLPEDTILGPVYRRFQVHTGVSDEDNWRIRVLHPERHGFDERWALPPEVQDELRWWSGQQARQHPTNLWAANRVRQEYHWIHRYALASPHGSVNGHTLPDHGIILEAGVTELRRQIAEHRRQTTDKGRQTEYSAMDRCLEGLQKHLLLCAEAGRSRSAELEDPQLVERLERAADRCEALAYRAPETLAEAVQLYYLSNLADRMDNPGDAASFGRIDQLLYPFYVSDLERGILSHEEAFELIGQLLTKCWCVQSSLNMTIGGTRPDGEDGTNKLTYAFIEALEATEMVVDMSVRLHSAAPADFFRTVMRVVRRGFGRPGLYNDDVTVEALVRKGIDVEDARDYAPLGCVEVMIPGRSAHRTMCMGMNLPKVLELTLNQGRCLVTGDLVWDDVPEAYASFDDLLAEYRRRVKQVVDLSVEIIREDERLEPGIYPRPWLTVLSRDGIADGIDLTAGQPKYDPVGATLVGLADIVNSLYATQHLVYNTPGSNGRTTGHPRLTLDQLRQALAADWEDHRALQRYVVHRLPRFGQDHPALNTLLRDEAAHYANCFAGHSTYYGGPFMPMIFGVTTSILYGRGPKTGATPSGRKQSEMLAQSLQPCTRGPQAPTTELLCALSAIDYHDYAGGISNVQECDPSLVQGEEGLDRLSDLVGGFFSQGGMELSLNFLTKEQLDAAQKDPDRYRYLMVRVFGLSAQFVNLAPELQETVIERVAAACRRG